jgi:penicillin-binding protein 2
MFERRLKIFLCLLAAMVGVLLLRAAQLQMVQREYWRHEAADTLRKVHFLETDRGAIKDCHGVDLAVDRPCVDACVDFRAITYPPDDKWLGEVATRRLISRLGDAPWDHTPRAQRAKLREKEIIEVRKDIDAMWDKFAALSGKPIEEIEQVRQAVLQRVQMRKRFVWHRNYMRALNKGDGQAADRDDPKWEKWLSGQSDDGPEIDKFSVTVAEETAPHVILHAIPLDVQNELGRHIDRYPGLVLRPGLRRYYPYDDVACHVIGHLVKVTARDMATDRHVKDAQRKYLPNDDIGRDGLESLCEPGLRGILGRTVTVFGDENAGSTELPTPGKDVYTSIDIELQQEIQTFFASATLHKLEYGKLVVSERKAVLHGAAVLLDVKTDRVLALVSYPTYDLNHFDEEYQELHDDQINDRLRDRATESQLEPGSTVKPLVGLSAITQGTMKVNQGIECTGYLVLPWAHGPHTYTRMGRCWVASMYDDLLHGAVAHHPIPVPHQGHDGNPDGYLTYSDALERSCNVYFETVADRMGIKALTMWMDRFGLGRKTGIGIEEYKGYIPGNGKGTFDEDRRATCFFGGIGQGYIAATPIQMANVAACIARDGIWMRPKLLIPDPATHKLPELRAGAMEGPDSVDLHLDPEALKACKLGMLNVVNGPAGTGKTARMDTLLVAGKTGTAQASPFKVLLLDPKGEPQRDAGGKKLYRHFEPSTPEHPNPDVPWYRGAGQNDAKLDHAWMIGFAPADDPKIAFAALVEYGGSGGGAAADVVRASLESCIAHGYLKARKPAPDAQQQASAPDTR